MYVYVYTFLGIRMRIHIPVCVYELSVNICDREAERDDAEGHLAHSPNHTVRNTVGIVRPRGGSRLNVKETVSDIMPSDYPRVPAL